MKEIQLVHRDQLNSIMDELRTCVEKGHHVITIKKKVNKRTITQNKAMHKYFEIIAENMNDAGITQKSLIGSFKDGFELPVTEHMIKDIFREVGRAMFRKDSTADISTKEISEVHRVVDQRFAEVTGVSAPWPSDAGQMMREYENSN